MNNKNAKIYIGIISILVIGLVSLMYSGWGLKELFDSRFPMFDKKILPFYNAIFNSFVSILLIVAFIAIKNKKIEVHRKLIYTATFFSTLFLLNYVLYHMISERTNYGGSGSLRLIYFIILASHILLAIISFPFILYTAFLGQTMQVDAHRKLAKIVFPVWLYVAITGVLVYIMISPFYS